MSPLVKGGEYVIVTKDNAVAFESFTLGETEYFEPVCLKSLGIEVVVSEEDSTVILQTSSSNIVISTKLRIAVVGDELITLDRLPVVRDGKTLIPLSYMKDFIPELTGAGSFSFGSTEDMMSLIDVVISCEGDLFRLKLSEPRLYKKENRSLCMVLDFPGTKVAPMFKGNLKSSSAIDRITHESYMSGDKLYFYYKNVGLRSYNAGDVSGDGGREIAISFVEKKFISRDQNTDKGEQENEKGIVLVLDPGHGGEAKGAVGPGGLLEKEAVLDLCRELKVLLENSPGIRVIMTRDTDINIPLEERTELANEVKADLFISVHANGSRRHDAQGAETYFLSYEATDDYARNLAAMENYGRDNPASPDNSEKTGLGLVLWGMAQAQFLEESSALAETIQQKLNAFLGVRNRGIRQAPFVVLKGATMPAVLVEIGFITNPEEERKLRQTDYRRKICEALRESVLAFKDQRERRLNAGSLGSGDE